MVVTRSIVLTVCLLTLLISAEIAGATEGPPPEERVRIGVGVITLGDHSAADGARLRSSATNILANSHEQALYFDAPADEFLADGELDLAKADAEQFDLFILMEIREQDGRPGYEVLLSLYDVRAEELLTTIRTESQVDRLGRYLRSSAWDFAVERLSPFIDAYRPFSRLTVETSPGTTITILNRNIREIADDDGIAELSLRNMRSYQVTLDKAGFRSEETTLFLGREPTRITLPLERYPIWTVSVSLKEAAFPGVGVGRYLGTTSLLLEISAVTHLFGFTPLRQLGQQFANDPGLVTSIPTTEFLFGADLYLRSRDLLLRPYVGIDTFMTLIHADYYTGIDPILPFGGGISFGLSQELAERLYAVADIESRFYYVTNRSLLVPYSFFYTLADTPIGWQPAILRLGLRYGI